MPENDKKTFSLVHWERYVFLAAVLTIGISFYGYKRLAEVIPEYQAPDIQMPPMPSVIDSQVITKLDLNNRQPYNPFATTFEIVKPKPPEPPKKVDPPKPPPPPPKKVDPPKPPPPPHTLDVKFVGFSTLSTPMVRLEMKDSKEGAATSWLSVGGKHKSYFTVQEATQDKIVIKDKKNKTYTVKWNENVTLNLD